MKFFNFRSIMPTDDENNSEIVANKISKYLDIFPSPQK
jgi:hypothetical protein